MNLNNYTYTVDELMAQKCRNSLFFFFKEFWSEIIADKLHLNWHIEYLCDIIQEIATGVIENKKINEDLLVNICPGTSKSTIVSIILPAWIWTRKPECVTLCNTRKDVNAKEFSLKFRKIIESDKYKLYFPEIIIRHDTNALKGIQNTSGGARRQYTTMTIPTGDHGHIRINDDMETYEDAISFLHHESVIAAYQTFSTREKKNAFVPEINVMQRVANGDICEHILEVRPNIRHIVLPAWLNEKVKPTELREFYVDNLLNPGHVNSEKLAIQKKILANRYLPEYGQICDFTEGFMYSVNKIKEIESKGISVAICDPADDGLCYTASIFAKVYNNKIYVTDIIYTQNPSEITIPINIEKAKKHNPFAFFVEKDGIGSLFGKQIRAGYPLVKFFGAKGDKLDRIYNASGIVSAHVVFLEDSPNIDYENAVNHLTVFKRIGTNKFVDFEDALTSLVDVVVKNNLINIYV